MNALRSSIVVALALVALPARADGGDADALFKAGRDAVKAGDWAAALALFEKSQKLDPAPGTLFNIATCEEHLGKLASAWRHLERVVADLPAGDDRRPAAKKQALALEPRLPKLELVLAPDAPSQTRVSCDGSPWPSAMLSTKQPVDPGKHVCEVSAPHHEARRFEVTLAEGQVSTQPVAPGPVDAGERTEGARPVETDRQRPAWIGYAVGGVGVVGLAVGGVTGVMVFGKKSTIGDQCDANKVCTSDGYDAVSSAKTLSTVSTVSFAVGLAGLAASAYLVLTAGPDSKSTTVAPLVLPGGGGLGVASRF